MKKHVISIVFIALLLLAACSNNEKAEVTEDVEVQEFFNMVESLNIVFDEEITNEIKQEVGIKDAAVTLTSNEQNPAVHADILVDSEVENIDDFTKKYVNKLKNKYPKNMIKFKMSNGSEILVEEMY